MGCPTVRGSDTSLILMVLPNFCPLFGFDTMWSGQNAFVTPKLRGCRE